MTTCGHGVDGGCPYCRALVIADDGPDSWEPYHWDSHGCEE